MIFYFTVFKLSLKYSWNDRPVAMKESHEKCPSCKDRVRFLCSSPKLISLLTGAPSRDDVSSHGLQNPKSSKASGDTNSEKDICIPAIYDPIVTLDLNPSIQTNKKTNSCISHISQCSPRPRRLVEWLELQELLGVTKIRCKKELDRFPSFTN